MSDKLQFVDKLRGHSTLGNGPSPDNDKLKLIGLVQDSGASAASSGCGSSFSDSFSASSATSSCESSGSCVVMFCSHTPGSVMSLNNAPVSFFADSRIIS